jgi:hypothetical protein
MPIKSSAALKILLGNGDSFSYASHSCVGERKTASKRKLGEKLRGHEFSEPNCHEMKGDSTDEYNYKQNA